MQQRLHKGHRHQVWLLQLLGVERCTLPALLKLLLLRWRWLCGVTIPVLLQLFLPLLLLLVCRPLITLLLTRQLCVQRLASRSGATRSDP